VGLESRRRSGWLTMTGFSVCKEGHREPMGEEVKISNENEVECKGGIDPRVFYKCFPLGPIVSWV